MGLSVRKVPAPAGTVFLAASTPPRARAGIMIPKRPINMSIPPSTL